MVKTALKEIQLIYSAKVTEHPLHLFCCCVTAPYTAWFLRVETLFLTDLETKRASTKVLAESV